MDNLIHIISSFTPQQWFLFGGLLASIPGTFAITEWVKRHHFKKNAEKLWSGFVVLNVAFWGTALAFVDALGANLSQITHIGSLIPQIAPFASTWGPRISIATLVIHSAASVLVKWWSDRKAHKPLVNPNLPDLTPAVEAVLTPVVASNPTEPPQNVLGM